MINAITPYRAPNVPKRDVVAPVQKVAKIELNPSFNQSQYESWNSSGQSSYSRPNNLNQNYSPYFAVHLLLEAGSAEDLDQNGGMRAYKKPLKFPQSLIAIV